MTRICVVRQFWFPDDVRVKREVDALLDAGYEVDVVCAMKPGASWRERRGRLTILRLPLSHRRGSALAYAGRYLAFLAMATVVVATQHIRRRYSLVQVNSVPDSLVFAALVPKVTGAKVIIDLHEAMPEFFATKFHVPLDHPGVRALAAIEQASIRFADAAVTCTEQQREAFAARGADPRRIAVVLNASDETIFDQRRFPRRSNADDSYTVICHGTIEPHYGLDTIVRAAALLRDAIPRLRVQIFGEGTYSGELEQLVRELGLEDTVWLSQGFVPYDELVAALASADVGVVAMKRDAFRDLTHCNKMFDFVVIGVPAAVSRTRSVEAYFDEDSFAFFESDDAEDLARVLLDLYRQPRLRQEMARHASNVAEPYRWPHQRAQYLSFVDAVLRGDRPAPGRDGAASPPRTPASAARART